MPSARSGALFWVVSGVEALKPALLAEAKFLKAPLVFAQSMGVVENEAGVPSEVAVAPVRTVQPDGRPLPILLKFSA
jgi:hypothetical protein